MGSVLEFVGDTEVGKAKRRPGQNALVVEHGGRSAFWRAVKGRPATLEDSRTGKTYEFVDEYDFSGERLLYYHGVPSNGEG